MRWTLTVDVLNSRDKTKLRTVDVSITGTQNRTGIRNKQVFVSKNIYIIFYLYCSSIKIFEGVSCGIEFRLATLRRTYLWSVSIVGLLFIDFFVFRVVLWLHPIDTSQTFLQLRRVRLV